MKKHFLLIKKEGFTKAGELISGEDAIKALAEWGGWSLFQNTRNRKQIKKGDDVAFYIGGTETKSQYVVAKARVTCIREWSHRDKSSYPLMLDDVPSIVVEFDRFTPFSRPKNVISLLDKLDLTPMNRTKWGAVLVGGVRRLTEHDFDLLTKKQVGAT